MPGMPKICINKLVDTQMVCLSAAKPVNLFGLLVDLPSIERLASLNLMLAIALDCYPPRRLLRP